ncbi:hypothetical protein LTR85_002544 [Meristemomyces frigidus]|nr:hypothetical protein LTR85_002544 [Meristemomyces frigidus]
MASYTYELAELGDDAHGLGCKCCRFKSGMDLPTPAKLTSDEIKQHGMRFSTSIISDWTRLNAVLKRYQGVIEKRWLKKNTKQRRDILLRAWPEMAACHRPDFAGFRKTMKFAPRYVSLFKAYLWPYINQEDLQQAHPLLLFLGSRGRSFPDNFISSDIEAAHLGRGWEFCPCGKHGAEAMQFFGQRSPRTYGRVAAVMENMPAGGSTPIKSVVRYHPGLGLLGLEIQAGIYRFLLQCTKLILHDVETSQLCYLAPHRPAPLPLEPKYSSEYRTLQDDALETPYRMPQEFDLARLTQLVGARRSSAEDHVILLREDPGYFAETLKEEKEHGPEYSDSRPKAWRAVAGIVITDSITYFLFWDDIHRRLKKMTSIASQLQRADFSAARLAPVDERLWSELEEITNLMLITPLSRLMVGVPVSPRMRHCYDASRKGQWVFRPKPTEAERRVDLLFHALTEGHQRSMHTLNHLVQEVQYMLDTEPGASELVDLWIAGHFADLALLSEIKLRIDSFEPWASGWRACGVGESEQVSGNVSKLLNLDGTFRNFTLMACHDTDLGDPTSIMWRYPADKRSSKAIVDQMRNAELLLDDYWHLIENKVWLATKRDLMKVLGRRGLHGRVLYRTPPWKEPIIIPQPETSVRPHAVLRELPTNTSYARDTVEPATATKKLKVKTRGTPAAATSQDEISDHVAEVDEATLTTVKVPRRTYKVLSALFPLAGAENHQSMEVSWDDLLHALNTIGLQPEKLYGSVWMFRPVSRGACKVELDLKRSIQFHEPKEVRRGNKISSSMVRTLGRRLKHAFGWEAGMFECE